MHIEAGTREFLAKGETITQRTKADAATLDKELTALATALDGTVRDELSKVTTQVKTAGLHLQTATARFTKASELALTYLRMLKGR